jgi:MYXO-CTERM domain-containing protein
MKIFALVFSLGLALVPMVAQAQCTPTCMNPNDPESDCDGDCCKKADDCNDNPATFGQTMRGPLCPGGGAFPPGVAPEVCDGRDNNCNSSTDEGNPGGGAACVTGQAGVCGPGTNTCTAGAIVCVRNVAPSAEVCDGLDNDCMNGVDNGNPGGGGMCPTGVPGICATGVRNCTAGALVCTQTVMPGTEVCNGLDDNCNGTPDEGFGVGGACTSSNPGVCAPGVNVCLANGTVSCASTVMPGSRTESCNGMDDNCNGATDEGNPGGGGMCATGVPGICANGIRNCTAGNLVCTQTVLPAAAELCNMLDDNCNGMTDEGFNVGQACAAAGVGRCSMGTRQCQANAGVCVGLTAIAETCNGVDDNCDGTPDNGNPGGGGACSVPGQMGQCAVGIRQCTAGSLQCPQINFTTPEICNGLDDNCNGQTDEGLVTDLDGDGVRACGTCNAPPAGLCDCNDNPAMNGALQRPGLAEVCDGIDNNCNTQIDEGVNRVCFTGPTGTFTGTCPGPNCVPRAVCVGVMQACTAGAFPACTAATPGQVLPTTEVFDCLDNDCDGVVDDGAAAAACTTGQMGVCNPGMQRCTGATLSCVRNMNPSAEQCNNLDDDCNGLVDDGTITRRCFSGPAGTFGGTCPGTNCNPFGECRFGTQLCNGAGMFLACTGEVLPATEICDTKDNNCNGQTDEGLITDLDMDSSRACGTCGALALPNCDCNDNPDGGSLQRPGLTETCDARDNNCNNQVDEGTGPTGKISQNCYSGPVGTAGVGLCVQGTRECNATIVGMSSFGMCVGEIVPQTEICDTKDNNCNNMTDEGFDVDNDGFRSCMACGNPMNCDCNDADPSIKPGATELCDTIDQNCNGQLDDVMPRKCFAGQNATSDSYTGTCPGPMCQPKGACVAGMQMCSAMGAWGSCAGQVLPANLPSGKELVCDNKDEDCDGTVDDGDFDLDMDGVRSCSGDCNDMNAAIKPGALEICDGLDNNCDNIVDGVNTGCYSGAANTRGKGICRDGTQQCVNGQGMGACTGEIVPTILADGGVPLFTGDAGVNSPEALCDNRDEDCDGLVDDGFDLDGDGVTTCQGDCDDRDALNRPGATERCDCHDNNCNGTIDEGNVCVGAPCHDFDRDGYTNCQGDCDDSPATGGAVGPQKSEVVGDMLDNDCDGATDEITDEDGDMVTTAQGDCNDKLAAIRPGAIEVCDGFDNNCNNVIDEGFDLDNDRVAICAGDCNDNDQLVNPTRREICANQKDDNCDGRIDEDTDVDMDGVTTCQGDCNDFNDKVHKGFGAVSAAAEICDGQDNDCNGSYDEGFDVDGDFFASCFGDCNDNSASVNPNQVEVPGNTIDDNCNGQVDEGATDRDNDGFTGICGDCNDADPNVNPRATEICDRVDNNCDSFVDSAPGRADLCSVCFDADGDGQTNCDGDCNDADPSIKRGGAEVCDMKDNDCDGMIDLDPQTGLRVCTADAGIDDGGDADAGADTDAGDVDSGIDAGSTGSDGGTTNTDPNVIVTGCGCSSGGEFGLLALALLALRKRKSVALGALTLSLSISACGSGIKYPPIVVVDAGQSDIDGGMNELSDGGKKDGGFVPPVAVWRCPGLSPVEHTMTAVPSTDVFMASAVDVKATPNTIAKAVLLDDSTRQVAAFVLAKDVPLGVDPNDITALETQAAREISSLGALAGTPLVRDTLERFSRVFRDDRMQRSFSTSQEVTFATPTNAFSVRNRLLSNFSGKSLAELGTLPTLAGADTQSVLIVSVFVRLTQEKLFIGAAVTVQSRFKDNQALLSDWTNGSHLSAKNPMLSYDCEPKVQPLVKTDFLFVIDNTPSMLEEQRGLQDAAQSLFDAFQRSGLDFRVGVITTDSDVLRNTGFTTNIDEFKAAARVGLEGNVTEMGIEFALRAIERAKMSTAPNLKLRDDAGLVVIFMSDEDNKAIRTSASYLTSFKMNNAVTFAIVGPRPSGCLRVGQGQAEAGSQYIDLSTQTGGSSGSICNPNLTEVIEEVLVGALGASSRSPLTRRPISGSLSVRVGTNVVPRNRISGFEYEPTSNNILFFGSTSPPIGGTFDVAFAFFSYIE